MKTSLPQKILSAIEKNRLKLVPGKKSWYGSILDIQELVWARNLRDGYQIEVYTEKYGSHLGTIIV